MSKIQEVTPATLSRNLPDDICVARSAAEAQAVADRWRTPGFRTRIHYRAVSVDNLVIPLWIVIQDRKETTP